MFFPTRDVYKKTIDWLFQNQDKLSDFLALFPNFTSAHQAFEEIDFSEIDPNNLTNRQSNFLFINNTDNGAFDVLPIVDAHLIAHIVNDEGLLLIGKKLQKFYYKTIVEAPINQLKALRSNNLTPENILREIPISRNVYTMDDQDVSFRGNRTDVCVNHYKRKKKCLEI